MQCLPVVNIKIAHIENLTPAKPGRQRNRAISLSAALLIALFLGWGTRADAHATGESYVWLNVQEDRFTGRVEINLDDMREKLGISIPTASSATAQTSESPDQESPDQESPDQESPDQESPDQESPDQESPASDPRIEVLQQNRSEILSYIEEHFQLHVDGAPVSLEFDSAKIRYLDEKEGNYAMYDYESEEMEIPDSITITNSLCFEGDTFHRSLLCVERNHKSGQEFSGEFVAMVFGGHNPTQDLDLTNIEGLLRPKDFVWQGVLHIWMGTDHVLFIIALLLPAVLVRKDNKWQPVASFKEAFVNILKIVTIFTIAHSITLSLAALGVVNLQSRFVESVIALSIIMVAANTIRPKFNDKTWLIIFGFGLFHGMGFASVMSDLPFRMVNLVKVLIGFNVGVELGQLAIVAVVFPLIYLFRSKAFYRPVFLYGGSLAIAAMACVWFAQRAFGVG